MRKKGILILILIILVGLGSWGGWKATRVKQVRQILQILEQADTLFEKGEWEAAISEYEKFLNQYSKFALPRKVDILLIYYRMGYANEKLGKFEEADKYWAKAGEEYLPFIDYFKADREWEKGNPLKCREMLLKWIKTYPRHEWREKVERRLEEIHTSMLRGKLTFPSEITYQVKPGDSLFKIARKFSSTIDLLMEKNNLSSPLIRPGMKLKVIPLKDFRIEIDLTKNELYLFYKDEFFKKYPIASGKDNLTPVGEFTVINKLKNPVWYVKGKKPIPPGSPENILGSRWIGIDEKRGIGIHEAVNPQDIGKYVSNGCIRMLKKDVEELYNLVIKGTPVKIYRSK